LRHARGKQQTHTNADTHTDIQTHRHTDTQTHACTQTRARTRTHTHLHTRTHTNTHTHTHTRLHTHTHTHSLTNSHTTHSCSHAEEIYTVHKCKGSIPHLQNIYPPQEICSMYVLRKHTYLPMSGKYVYTACMSTLKVWHREKHKLTHIYTRTLSHTHTHTGPPLKCEKCVAPKRRTHSHTYTCIHAHSHSPHTYR